MVRPCVARGFVEVAVSGLASMYPASDWSAFRLPAIMDISARASSLRDRPHRAKWVTSVRMRREYRSSISAHPPPDLAGEEIVASAHPPLRCSRNALCRDLGA